MPAVNNALKDAALRHQVFLQRYGGATANKIIALLARSDADLVGRIAARMEKIDKRGFDLGPATTQRLQRLLDEIRVQQSDLYKAVHNELRSDLTKLTDVEVKINADRLKEAIGVDLGILRPAPETLRAAVVSQPFRGRILKEWVSGLEAGKVRALTDAIRIGITQGATTADIVRRVRGTAARKFKDGILEINRRNAEILVRTATNHVATRARELLFEANDDVVKGVQWIATLDNRTCPICAGLDGQMDKELRGMTPPAHAGCRCTLTPVVRSWDELAKDGALKRGRGADDIDTLFQKRLREKGFSAEEAATIKRNTRASMDGQVSGKLTYSDWLRRQPAAFQDDVIGVTKGRLFRSGKIDLDRFIDSKTARPLTLVELRAKNQQAWMSAKLPETGSPVLR